MQLEKKELSKIIMAKKLFLEEMSEEDINTLNCTIIFAKESFVIIESNNTKIQCQIKIQNVDTELKFNASFKEILKVCETFTKKTDIEIKYTSDKITFIGNVDKEEVKVIVNISKSEKINSKISESGTFTLSTPELLESLGYTSKILRDVPQINTETLVEIESAWHKLTFATYSDIELMQNSFITENEEEPINMFLNKEEFRIFLNSIKNLKALEIDFSLKNNKYLIAGNGLVMVKNISKKTGLSVLKIIENIFKKCQFIAIKFNGLDIDTTLQKDYLYFRKNEDGVELTNKEIDNKKFSYSYRANKVFNKNEINSIMIDKDYHLLLVKEGNYNYILMPKKETVI